MEEVQGESQSETGVNQGAGVTGDGAGWYPVVEPHPVSVRGADLLSEIEEGVRRYIVCGEDTAAAVALWCAFTWFIDSVQVAPIAIITAPEKRCGKTNLLEFMGLLCSRPLTTSSTTGSPLFRIIDRDQPTLLIDEADSFFRLSEQLRGIINSGHTRSSAYVLRTVKEVPTRFSTWGAKAICGIGSLPSTIMDRGIIFTLRRKLPTERIESLRHSPKVWFALRASMLARWSLDNRDEIARARPTVPEDLNDREQDSWEPLLAIADLAGGDWPRKAREAALSLSRRNRDDTASSGVELLEDIRDIFGRLSVDRIASLDLLRRLNADKSKPWRRQMEPKQLARMLRGYGVHPGTIRLSTGATPKGYKQKDFSDAFARYL